MTSSVAAAFVLLVLVYSVDGDASCLWDYEGNGDVLGPDRWGDQFPECGKTRQSPIDIQTSKVMHDPFLKIFDLRNYYDILSYPNHYTMKLENVGHTVTLTYSGESPVVIRGGNLPEDYVLYQLHFHWGSCNDSGSEHQIDGESEVMEMHIVHHKRTLTRESSANKTDGLAVLAFFFKVGKHNAALEVLEPYIKKVTYKHNQTDVSSFSLYDLLLRELYASPYYYRYNGSLTYPPCYQTVIWSVFPIKLELSEKQLEVFRTLRGETGDIVVSDNFRPVQPLNSRIVYSNDPVYKRGDTAGPMLPPPPVLAEYHEYLPPPVFAEYHEYLPPPVFDEDPEYPDM